MALISCKNCGKIAIHDFPLTKEQVLMYIGIVIILLIIIVIVTILYERLF